MTAATQTLRASWCPPQRAVRPSTASSWGTYAFARRPAFPTAGEGGDVKRERGGRMNPNGQPNHGALRRKPSAHPCIPTDTVAAYLNSDENPNARLGAAVVAARGAETPLVSDGGSRGLHFYTAPYGSPDTGTTGQDDTGAWIRHHRKGWRVRRGQATRSKAPQNENQQERVR